MHDDKYIFQILILYCIIFRTYKNTKYITSYNIRYIKIVKKKILLYISKVYFILGE